MDSSQYSAKSPIGFIQPSTRIHHEKHGEQASKAIAQGNPSVEDLGEHPVALRFEGSVSNEVSQVGELAHLVPAAARRDRPNAGSGLGPVQRAHHPSRLARDRAANSRGHLADPAGGAANLDAVSAQVAIHYEQGGLSSEAVPYFQRAAGVAQRVYANSEAIHLLNRRLVLLASLPPSHERDELELALQTELGTSLVATQSYGGREVMLVYRRTRELCQQLGQPTSPPILRALAIASIAHADFQQARGLGDQLLSLATRDSDPVLLVEGHYVLGVVSVAAVGAQ